MRSPSLLFTALGLLLVVALGLAIACGSTAMSLSQLAIGLLAPQSLDGSIVWQLRLPRALAALVCGGLLAVAGCLMQILLRNPLADPSILGVSGGAATAALLAISFGLSGTAVSQLAFLGALGAMSLVLLLADVRQHWDNTRLLLTGVVVAAGWGACISFILTMSPDKRVHSMLFWLMGDLSDAPVPWLAGAGLLLALVLATAMGRHLNVLMRGELQARALGVPVTGLRLSLYLLACLTTALAVTLGGTLGFVGLVVPHLLRLLGVVDHRLLVPACALLGGALVMLADTLARSLLAPVQLPVGVVTAFLGVPVFLWILRRSGGHP